MNKPPIEDLFDLTVDDCEMLIYALIVSHKAINEVELNWYSGPETDNAITEIEKALKKVGCYK